MPTTSSKTFQHLGNKENEEMVCIFGSGNRFPLQSCHIVTEAGLLLRATNAIATYRMFQLFENGRRDNNVVLNTTNCRNNE